jgi:hypothetical protein
MQKQAHDPFILKKSVMTARPALASLLDNHPKRTRMPHEFATRDAALEKEKTEGLLCHIHRENYCIGCSSISKSN